MALGLFLDLLGQRWMMRVIWELQAGPHDFLELRRKMNNCSSSMLAERLQQLTTASLTAKNASGAWELTSEGVGLAKARTSIWDWSQSWAR
nr:winged helix-turn-helix transcriptional regulator [Mycobacteroides abscessus]